MQSFYVSRSPNKVIISIIQKEMINFITCFHNQLEIFFQIKFHPGMKFRCKQDFFIKGRVSFQNEISSLFGVIHKSTYTEIS